MRYEKLAKEIYQKVLKLLKSNPSIEDMKEVLKKELSGFNDVVQKEIEKSIENEIDEIPSDILTGVRLSDRLYHHSKEVIARSSYIIKEHIKSKETISELSKKLYEGYGFNDKEILNVKKRLPKYILKELNKDKNAKRLELQAKRLKTSPLRAAYKQIADSLDDVSYKATSNALKVALEEKSRYYAHRIAMTETFRAKNYKNAKEYLNDNEIEFVKFSLSSLHPMRDICDFYAGIDIGYGKGVVPKEQMRALPLHPFCRCKYEPVYLDSKEKAKYNDINPKPFKKASKEFINSLDEYQKREILGSKAKVLEFKKGEDVENIFNRVRPKYPIRLYVDEFRYNNGMKPIFNEKIITKDEKEAIVKWTEDSSDIKKVMWELSEDKRAKKYADTLFSLFDKYESNLKKGTKLYRGISFTKEDFIYFGYDKVKRGSKEVPDHKAIVSFSANKRKAFEYATITDRKYKVVYILENEDEALDISKISAKPEEKESIITKGKEYLVAYTRIFKRGEELWKVIKLKKKME